MNFSLSYQPSGVSLHICRFASLALALIICNGNKAFAMPDDDLLLLVPMIAHSARNAWSSLPVPQPNGGFCPIPSGGGAENTSRPDHVIGNGTAASCTSAAVVAAVAKGGVITFNCGSRPVEIVMQQTAKVFNNTGPKIVLDGGGKVTLSGGGARRILYMNTCDPNQIWTTPHCQNQDHPQLTVQNLTFKNGNSKSETEYDGGGAIWVRGGRFKIVNSRFENNVCASTGPDVGGAAVRVFSQYLLPGGSAFVLFAACFRSFFNHASFFSFAYP